MLWQYGGVLAIATFLFAKFLAYSVFCMFAPRWLAFHEYHPVKFGLLRGGIRMLIGFVGMWLIILILMNSGQLGLPGWSVYLLAYAPVRVVEWLALFLLIAVPLELPFAARGVSWIGGGVLVSFLCDGMAIALFDSKLMDFRIGC